MTGVSRSLAFKPRATAESSFCSQPKSKLTEFHITRMGGWSSFPSCGMCGLQNPRKPRKKEEFLCKEVARYSNLSYTLERPHHVPDYQIPKNFTEGLALNL